MPAAVVADVGTLKWVNSVLGSVWPKLNEALANHVHERLVPRLRERLPLLCKNLRCIRFDLGEGAPECGDVEVTRYSPSHVQIELDLDYRSAVDILMDVGGGISLGVNYLECSGRLSIVLNPLVGVFPVVGAMHLCFVNQPYLKLKFGGLARAINEMPFLERTMLNAVEEIIGRSLVLPNCKSFQLAQDHVLLGTEETFSPYPIGVLRVQILRARNLAGSNWSLSSNQERSSDPYCVLKLGGSSSRTSTIKGTINPEWPTGEPSAYFTVYHRDQELSIDVLDDDQGIVRTKRVSFLGRMPGTNVKDLFSDNGLEVNEDGFVRRLRVVLDTSSLSKSFLHRDDSIHAGLSSELEIDVEWFDLQHEPVPGTLASADLSSRSQAAMQKACPLSGKQAQLSEARQASNGTINGLLLVKFHAGTDFPAAYASKDLRWRCRLLSTAMMNNSDASAADPQHMQCDMQASILSQRGSLHKEKPDFSKVELSSSMLLVVDRLFDKDMPIRDIADIVGTRPDVVETYLRIKKEYEDRLRSRTHQRIQLWWHQTLPIVVPRNSSARLHIELVDGRTQVLGRLDEISLEELSIAGWLLPRTSLELHPPPVAGVKSMLSWAVCQCSMPVVDGVGGHVDVSIELEPLVEGTCPAPARSTQSDCNGELPVVGQGSRSGSAEYKLIGTQFPRLLGGSHGHGDSEKQLNHQDQDRIGTPDDVDGPTDHL